MLNKDDVADDLQNAILGQGGLVAWLQSARFTVIVMLLQTTRPSLPQIKENAWYKNIFSHRKKWLNMGWLIRILICRNTPNIQSSSNHPSSQLLPEPTPKPAKRCSLPSVAARHSWNQRVGNRILQKHGAILACYKE